MNISKIEYNKTHWINIYQIGDEELAFLSSNFPFSVENLEACKKDTQHSAIQFYPDYIFISMLFPIYNRTTKIIEPTELNIFLKDNMFITVHDNKLLSILDFFSNLEVDLSLRKKYFIGNPTIILYELLDRLLDSYFPMLDHINEDIKKLETGLFSAAEYKNTKKILRIRQNIITFRRTMQAHKNIIQKLISKGDSLFSVNSLKLHYNNLIEQLKDIWMIIESQKESVEILNQTNESLISFELNNIMKALTVLSIVIAVPSLVMTMFSVASEGTPFINSPHGFLILIFISIFSIVPVMWFFKRKKWM
jgi:magnesium transporter